MKPIARCSVCILAVALLGCGQPGVEQGTVGAFESVEPESIGYAPEKLARLGDFCERAGSAALLILLPPLALREYARLEKKLVLVGQGNKLELWSETLWLAEREQALQDSGPEAELPEDLLSLKL